MTYIVILVELTNTVFANATNITKNIESAVLSTVECWSKMKAISDIVKG